MAINTAECVRAITKYYYDKGTSEYTLLDKKQWKRLSKSGAGNSINRVFEHRKTGAKMEVISSDTSFFSITEIKGKPVFNDTTIKGYLLANIKEGMGYYDLSYELMGPANIDNWPTVTLEDIFEDGEDEVEPLDMENFEWISINENEVVVACGGDWQEPLTLTIQMVNGRPTVIHSESGFNEGMGADEFNRILGISIED